MRASEIPPRSSRADTGRQYGILLWAHACRGGKADTQPTQEDVQKAIDRIPPIPVFGLALDHNGKSVAEAEVEVSWETPKLGFGWATDVRSEWVRTDENGRFKWTLVRDFNPVILRVQKEGYELLRDQNPYFDPMTGRDLMIGSTTRKAPLLFVLRKKGETTFLLKRDRMRLVMKLGDDAARFPDILPGPDQAELDVRAETKTQSSRQIGFGAKVEYSANDFAYRLTFVAPEGGAVFLSDKILYEAPAQGYQSDATTTISAKGNEKRLFLVKKPMWLFIKTAEPTVYARVDIDFDAVTPSIRFKSAVNPYGERNFEEESGFDYSIREQLEFDARINLRHNIRPAKPDLPRLVKEAKEKAVKDKGKP